MYLTAIYRDINDVIAQKLNIIIILEHKQPVHCPSIFVKYFRLSTVFLLVSTKLCSGLPKNDWKYLPTYGNFFVHQLRKLFWKLICYLKSNFKIWQNKTNDHFCGRFQKGWTFKNVKCQMLILIFRLTEKYRDIWPFKIVSISGKCVGD